MSEQTTVTVVIRGTELIFRTDDPEYIKELAEFVAERIAKIAQEDNVAEPTTAITLAAFNIADELFTLRKEQSETSEEVSRRLDAMLKMADETYRSVGPSDAENK